MEKNVQMFNCEFTTSDDLLGFHFCDVAWLRLLDVIDGLLIRSRNTASLWPIKAVLGDARMSTIIPQETNLHKYASHSHSRDQWKPNGIPGCIRYTKRAKGDRCVANIDDCDCQRNNDGTCLRLFSHQLGHPRHERRGTGVGSICQEVETQHNLVIGWPRAQDSEDDGVVGQAPDADLPAPVFPIGQSV